MEQTTENINPSPATAGSALDSKGQASSSREDGSAVRKSKGRKIHHAYKILLTISLTALTISTCLSVFFFMKWDEAASNYIVVLTEKNSFAQRLTMLKGEYDKLLSQMSVIRDPLMSIVSLSAKDSTQHFKAIIYYNPITAEAYIDTQNLPLPPADKQYQLWARINNPSRSLPLPAKPGPKTGEQADSTLMINISILSMEETGIQKLKSTPNVNGWTITMEPRGGSAVPTMGQIVAWSRN